MKVVRFVEEIDEKIKFGRGERDGLARIGNGALIGVDGRLSRDEQTFRFRREADGEMFCEDTQRYGLYEVILGARVESLRVVVVRVHRRENDGQAGQKVCG